eukprot:741776_1
MPLVAIGAVIDEENNQSIDEGAVVNICGGKDKAKQHPKVQKIGLFLIGIVFLIGICDIDECIVFVVLLAMKTLLIESYLALAHSYLEPICEYNGQKRAELWDKKEPQKHDEIYSLLDSPQNTRYEWYQFINKSATSARE